MKYDDCEVKLPADIEDVEVAISEPVKKLGKDLKAILKSGVGVDEARYLVDTYYLLQGQRLRVSNQVRDLEKAGEPHLVLDWLLDNAKILEGQIKNALNAFSDSDPSGVWLKSVRGIGPVLAAGLIAYIDIAKAPTAGHIWSYAGISGPTVAYADGMEIQEWAKGEKRPWNASLKTLCWKIGESFVKVHNHPESVYGKLYAEKKLSEEVKNEKGLFADQAKAKLEKYKIGKDTKAYSFYAAGKLPPAHIHARAKRYAVKLFLSHVHHIMYVNHFKQDPPKPFAIAQLGHAHYIRPEGV